MGIYGVEIVNVVWLVDSARGWLKWQTTDGGQSWATAVDRKLWTKRSGVKFRMSTISPFDSVRSWTTLPLLSWLRWTSLNGMATFTLHPVSTKWAYIALIIHLISSRLNQPGWPSLMRIDSSCPVRLVQNVSQTILNEWMTIDEESFDSLYLFWVWIWGELRDMQLNVAALEAIEIAFYKSRPEISLTISPSNDRLINRSFLLTFPMEDSGVFSVLLFPTSWSGESVSLRVFVMRINLSSRLSA